HGGQLTQEQAETGLAWRDGGPAPRDRGVRRTMNLVHPGSKHPHGPIQAKVSEIFDADDPPFFKNFLRIETTGDHLKITCIKVTGKETSAECLTAVETIDIPLARTGDTRPL
ncbi:MAG: hypothetical protein QOJ29_4138, partial [Thermoleophilaceae bacterium]|nr:hypothetical protein [Thermoleophilaceae bacterium]